MTHDSDESNQFEWIYDMDLPTQNTWGPNLAYSTVPAPGTFHDPDCFSKKSKFFITVPGYRKGVVRVQ